MWRAPDPDAGPVLLHAEEAAEMAWRLSVMEDVLLHLPDDVVDAVAAVLASCAGTTVLMDPEGESGVVRHWSDALAADSAMLRERLRPPPDDSR